MKQITKIRIPKGRYCEECKWVYNGMCRFFSEVLFVSNQTCKLLRTDECLNDYPNGAVFELKEDK